MNCSNVCLGRLVLTLPLFSVFTIRVLLECAYFLFFNCFQWITYSELSAYKKLPKTKNTQSLKCMKNDKEWSQ